MIEIEKFHMEHDRWTSDNAMFESPRGFVIHYDVGTSIDSTMQYLLESVDKNPNKSASYHYLISRSGRIVELNDPKYTRAWHAGRSSLDLPSGEHLTSLNKSSIGICCCNHGYSEAPDDPNKRGSRRVLAPAPISKRYLFWEPYPLGQIAKLAELIKHVESELNFSAEFIVGHEDVSPGRKVDPGPLFPWSFLWENLNLDYLDREGPQEQLFSRSGS